MKNEDELNGKFHFDSCGGFDSYKKQFGSDDIWPMAILVDICIDVAERFKGLGSRGLRDFSRKAREANAKSGFLKVSPSDDQAKKKLENAFASAVQSNIEFYQKNGGILLENLGNHRTLPFMYCWIARQ